MPTITLFGMKVVVAEEWPRYVLPSDVPPPPGMTRAEFDAWSRRVCGMVCATPRGSALVINGQMVVLHPDDYRSLCAEHKRIVWQQQKDERIQTLRQQQGASA